MFGRRGVVSFDEVEFEFVRGLGVGGVAGSINPRAVAALGSGTVLHVNTRAVGVDVGVFDLQEGFHADGDVLLQFLDEGLGSIVRGFGEDEAGVVDVYVCENDGGAE